MSAAEHEPIEPATESWLQRVVRSLTPTEAIVWGLALVLYVGGDMASTAVGIQLGAVEHNPVARLGIIHLGLWPALGLLKTTVIAWTVACWRHASPGSARVVYPGIVAVAGAGITAWNAWIIWQVL